MTDALNPSRHEAASAVSSRSPGRPKDDLASSVAASAALGIRPGPGGYPGAQLLRTWWPVLIGLLALYLPTYYDLAHGIWNSEEQAHGPIVLVVALYLIWERRGMLFTADHTHPLLGWALLLFGLLLYALGRSQEILLFEVGSQIPVLLGTLLITLGMRAARSLWFALFFLLFMIPLPGFVVDAATGPLKQYISILAEQALYIFGYPIARSGVTLTIGPYQLLVADACSGLHSLFSLSAMGLLYLYMIGHKNWLRNGLLIASILPIAFFSNVARVLLLVLITYYLGDAAGQGFLHGAAGVLLFIIALLLLFLLDGLLAHFFKPDAQRLSPPCPAGPCSS